MDVIRKVLEVVETDKQQREVKGISQEGMREAEA